MVTYLDWAATSFPKPKSVTAEMMRCMKEYCGNPGRGSHKLSLAAAETLFNCREYATNFFGGENPDNAVFALNATHALNMAIFGLIPNNSHIIISDLEHNSVLRPVLKLCRDNGVTYSVFKTKGNIIENIEKCLKESTVAVICTHASNIINRVLPISNIGRFCKKHGLMFIVDASQSAGAYDINMKRDFISALCFPGHKGLLGPEGCGMAIFADGILPKPFIYGGSGINSLEQDMPGFLPDRLEGGTAAVPAVAGLLAGLKYLKQVGLENVRDKEANLTQMIFDKLSDNKKITVYTPPGGALFLFTVDGQTPQTTAALLNKKGICVRSGLHCAPLAHKTAKTPDGGAVRASVGYMTTHNDIIKFVRTLESII